MLAADPDTNLLGPFSTMDADMETLRIRKTFYPPITFIRIFLKWYLTPMEAWNRIPGAIINKGL